VSSTCFTHPSVHPQEDWYMHFIWPRNHIQFIIYQHVDISPVHQWRLKMDASPNKAWHTHTCAHAHTHTHTHIHIHLITRLTSYSLFLMDKTDGLYTSLVFMSMESSSPTTSTSLSTLTLSPFSCKIEIKR
jgi:hypothetical protein